MFAPCPPTGLTGWAASPINTPLPVSPGVAPTATNAHKITRKLPIPNHLIHGAIHATKLLPSSFRGDQYFAVTQDLPRLRSFSLDSARLSAPSMVLLGFLVGTRFPDIYLWTRAM